jgi:hypothetical protein
MSEYTPITETVRTRYIQHGNCGVKGDSEAFDRWLAEHDAEVAAKSLKDAADALDKLADLTDATDAGMIAHSIRARAQRIREGA